MNVKWTLILAPIIAMAGQSSALTTAEIKALDGGIILGNRKSGGKIQIFDRHRNEWSAPLWEYNTRKGVDGLTVEFDHFNDQKRVWHNHTEYILISGNGDGIALYNLETEEFDFSYDVQVADLSTSVHAAEILPDGNFVVADPTGSNRGGANLRLIHGDNSDPKILQSIPYAGIHAVVWDHKRKRLWAWGSKLRRFRYVSDGQSSRLIQDGSFDPPSWGAGAHDMMPMVREGQADRLIFNCQQGIGTFDIESESFELLYGTIQLATHVLQDDKVMRGKGVDHHSTTGEVICNKAAANKEYRPGEIINSKMASWEYTGPNEMAWYKAHWFQHNTFSYGTPDGSGDPSLSRTFIPANFDLDVEQLTSGEKHHFFGYIGQCQTIPWNKSGRFILGMEIDRIDRMPEPNDAATIILVDTHKQNKIIRVDQTRAWNPQQGTMFYWNPLAPETQFFFNDRDVKSGKVFTVLYDIGKRRRVREYRYADTPIGNGGVAVDGSAWLGLNYGRLARLRLVTGYPGALDWSKDEPAPENDGMFIVDIETGRKRLLVSYQQLEAKIKELDPDLDHDGIFINHTLWNRDCDRIYFIARAGWNGKGKKRVNVPFSIHADGTGLTHQKFIGGHPEWAEGSRLIGRQDKNQIVYDVDQKKIIEQWGNPGVFPNPEGDISLSPDGNWFANGYKKGDRNFYTIYRRSDGAHAFSKGIHKGNSSGNIRIDPAPRWNRTNDAILVPGLAKNATRQMFLIRVIKENKEPMNDGDPE